MSNSEEESETTRQNSYDFEVPNNLVGLLIGIKGKTIKSVSQRANVTIHVREHHDPMRSEAFQIFEIKGRKFNVGRAIRCFREEFPVDRFPEITFKRVVRQYIQLPMVADELLGYLFLPEEGLFDIHISSVLDINHFFVQLPLNPSFKMLPKFDIFLSELYTHSPKPSKFIITPDCYENLMCVAPLNDKWYRAVALRMNDASKEMLVKFVDYGGFSNIPQDKIRYTVREDVMELPFQAVECRLADIQPLNGLLWTNQARTCFQNICMKKIVKAKLIGHHCIDGLPYIRIFVLNKKNKLVRFDEYLVKQRHAKAWDPSSCRFLDGTTITPKKTFAECLEKCEDKIKNNLFIAS